jgi:hypothetical protein
MITPVVAWVNPHTHPRGPGGRTNPELARFPTH